MKRTWMQRLALALYSGLAWLAIPLLRRKLRRRAQAEPGYAQAVPERFGHYDSEPVPGAGSAQDPLVWIHAVSLGETRAAALLIGPLRELLPGMRLLLTHGTATGRAQGAGLLRPGDRQAWLPWDTPGAVRRFLRHFRPAVGVLMETEVWPNLVHGCHAERVALMLVNARLNDKSLQRSLRLACLARPAYAALAGAWAQTEADARRLSAVGAHVQAVWGNLKFDAQPDRALLDRGRAWRTGQSRPVVVLASTREGEEAMWLENIKQKRPLALDGKARAAICFDSVQWLLVPRHPQRFDAVAVLCESAGLSVSRRSAWTSAPQSADVWLGDSMGEMALYYGLADVALLGGSFAPLGGQNLVEAIACACPVVLGPHTFNFSEVADGAVQAGAAVRVADMAQALAQACDLARPHEPRRAQMVQDGADFVARHHGAARKTAQAIMQWCVAGAHPAHVPVDRES